EALLLDGELVTAVRAGAGEFRRWFRLFEISARMSHVELRAGDWLAVGIEHAAAVCVGLRAFLRFADDSCWLLVVVRRRIRGRAAMGPNPQAERDGAGDEQRAENRSIEKSVHGAPLGECGHGGRGVSGRGGENRIAQARRGGPRRGGGREGQETGAQRRAPAR